ncbi:transposase [Synechococcus sp. ROS8604]|uniref:transposase n=1 Tax=Synechococcus sp. ROS8604 TaxID=1442557 RepID=UPI001646828A|nr:transposase [Synechococcus sp. ROS8604]QNI89852.1 transposase IS200 like family protein [Synechococcus sp. ROS8604]
MGRTQRKLPAGHAFHITLRCNSRQFLIAKGLRRDVLLAVLTKAKQKVPHKLYAVCLMANHLHLLIRPDDASQLPKLMHWVGWYSAMALNRLSGRCGHFWEARYYATAIAPKDHRRVLNTLRYIHANPKAAGVRKGFYDPYSNYGHYGRLECDGISEWHPSFLQLASSLKGCSRRYARFCQKYRHHAKGTPKCHWGSSMLKRLVEKGRSSQSRKNRVSPGQQKLPFAFDIRLNQIPEEWHQVAVRFRRANGIRDGDQILKLW